MSEQIKTLFQEHDIKFTAARSSILEVLKEAHHPLNYEQIKEKMNVIMDKATFYRNIAMFEEAGIVHKFAYSFFDFKAYKDFLSQGLLKALFYLFIRYRHMRSDVS